MRFAGTAFLNTGGELTTIQQGRRVVWRSFARTDEVARRTAKKAKRKQVAAKA